ncbi:unnamed protein product [Parajaminaea phylloscopi]
MVGRFPSVAAGVALALAASSASAYSSSYVASPSGLPDHTETGQVGTNNCGTGSSPTSMCQNAYLNSVEDFCLFSTASRGAISDHEGEVISYCTKSGRGTRLIPPGTIHGASFVYAPDYVQVTGNGDLTKINVIAGDEGGELDPHGATGVGNPVGGLVFHCSNGKCNQLHEWAMFMSATEYCFRACYDGPRATSLCRHTYDVLGCGFNMPANYPDSYFETCDSEDAQDIAYYDGKYFAQDMTKQGVPVPNPHPPPATSNCKRVDGNALYGDLGANAFTPPATNINIATSSAFHNTSTPTTSSTSSTSTSSSSSSTSNTSMTTNTTAAPTNTTTQPNGKHAFVSAASATKVGYAAGLGLIGVLAGALLL